MIMTDHLLSPEIKQEIASDEISQNTLRIAPKGVKFFSSAGLQEEMAEQLEGGIKRKKIHLDDKTRTSFNNLAAYATSFTRTDMSFTRYSCNQCDYVATQQNYLRR